MTEQRISQNDIANHILTKWPGVSDSPDWAYHTAHAVQDIVDETLSTIDQQRLRVADILVFADREWSEQQKVGWKDDGYEALFPNIDKLLPRPMSREEYDSYDIETRKKFFKEMDTNRLFLIRLLNLCGAQTLRETDPRVARILLEEYNENYSHFKRFAEDKGYQGADRDPPFSESREGRQIRHEYWKSRQPVEAQQ